MIRRFRQILLLTLLPLVLTGCLTEFPLTSSASTNLNTRLLGVFEYREKVRRAEGDTRDVEIKVHRVAVIPRDEDTYWIFYRNTSEKPVKTLKFIGWISRVDNDYYLTIQDDTDGSPTRGKFSFVSFDWRWPGNIDISTPNLADLEAATPFEQRKAVRARLKDGTLFPYESTSWDKIARIYWDRKSTDPAATIPKEFETGTEEKGPLL